MTTRPRAAALLAALLAAAAVGADGPPQAALDFTANPRLFDTHFGRYGPRATQVAVRDATGLRLVLPAEAKGAKQTGLYAYFALAGDFEIAAGYEVLDLPPPTTGYGAGFGFAAATDGPDGEVAVRRGQWKGDGSGVQVVRAKPSESGEMKYEATFFKTPAKRGRIVLRREKAEVVVLAADAPAAEPVERVRLPFTAGTVRNVRVYADSGGSPTTVDGRLVGLTVRADEITGGIPAREREKTPLWVVAVAVGSGVVLGLGKITFLRGLLCERHADAERPTPYCVPGGRGKMRPRSVHQPFARGEPRWPRRRPTARSPGTSSAPGRSRSRSS